MFARLRPRLTYANLMATVAVFIALGGTSVATHEAIFSDDIVDGQVQRQDLGFEAVSTGKILDGTVRTQDLQSGALTTSSIAAGAVTAPKLAANAVTGAKVADNTLTGADIDESSLALPDRVRLYHAVEAAEVTTSSSSFTDLDGPSITVDVPAGALVEVFTEVEGKACGSGFDLLPGIRLFEATDFPDRGSHQAFLNTNDFESQFIPVQVTAGHSYPATAGIRTYEIQYTAGSRGCDVTFRYRKLWVKLTSPG